jgi:2-oxoisovalerate dehydrogenase E1 component alpha subunit
MYAISTPIDD